METEADGGLLLHEFFENAVRRWPERVAVDVPPGTGRPERTRTTYAELNRASEAIARRLHRFVAGECIVGILLQRTSARLYASQLGVLKAGAAYVCPDTAFPDERAREILDDAGVAALLTDAAGRERALRIGLDEDRVIDVGDVLRNLAGTASQGARTAPPSPGSLAYVVYTSGTTGRPKGVMIEHRGIANLVASDLEEFQLSPDDRVAQGSSAAYDSSVEEAWLAFAAGAALVVMDDEAARLGPDLVPWLRRERVTVFCPPPTLLRTTGCARPDEELPDLRLLYVGGEALPRDVADRWAKGRRLVNGYGPTECSVTALRGDVEAGQPITIGRPVPGLRAWALDESLGERPDGDPGELCLGGLGLARGYWKRPDLTAEKFALHPRLGRLYRTGDLVHREADGRFFYHGRIDSQVKVRGYRVELGEIEVRLTQLEGVRAAACRVESDGTREGLVAFLVAADPAHPPLLESVRSRLLALLPAHMVPARFGFVEALPTTVGGKLDRAALPCLGGGEAGLDRRREPPRNAMETALEAAVREVLHLTEPAGIHDDFFEDLAGDSLSAALLVTALREEPATAWVSVRDVYEARTLAELALRAPAAGPGSTAKPEEGPATGGRPLLATLIQAALLALALFAGSIVAYAGGFLALPWLVRTLGLVATILLAPMVWMAALSLYVPLSLGLAVVTKRTLVGRYRPLRAPVWGSFYVRNWIVQQTVRLVPWRLLEGTALFSVALRTLGAKIGRRVHFHRGVDLRQGGWDLLEVGDDVTISQDAALRLVDLDGGEIVVGRVSIGEGATLDVRSGVAGETVLEAGSYLAPFSSLPPGGRVPEGELWAGIPAHPGGRAPAPPPFPEGARRFSESLQSAVLAGARVGVTLLVAAPAQALMLLACVAGGVTAGGLGGWLFDKDAAFWPVGIGLGLAVLAVPVTLAWAAAVSRILGRVPVGVISRWSPAYVRVWLKSGLLQGAGDWLSGTLLWPVWLRLAGMKVGPGCEISTITDVVPEHVEIGPESFFADGIYMGSPRIHRGTVTLAETRLGRNTFLGNHVVIPAGQRLPDGMLLGVCTVPDEHTGKPGGAWFGNPPFELPRREVVECDRRLTHDPSLIRYANRVFWELLRFTLPVPPFVVLVTWARALAVATTAASRSALFLFWLPLSTLVSAAALCLFVLGLKWFLLGRVRPGQHPLWSCWCSRWDFLYVVWRQHARPFLALLEGTLLLPWYLRAMGMRIGRRVVLGGGFAQVVDPDMIEIEDGATVNAMFQAHTFEDRVLKIDRIRVGRGATLGCAVVPLYGADIGEGTHVAAHSVIMKRERLLPGVRYEGVPTRREEK